MLKALATGFVILASALSLSAKPPVSIRVNTKVGMSPKDITVFIELDPHEANRFLSIAVDNGNTGISTLVQLDGLDAPETLSRTFRRLGQGHYLVVAALQRAGNTHFQATTSFCLNGPNVSCTD